MMINEKTAAVAIRRVAAKYHVSEEEVRREIDALLLLHTGEQHTAPGAESFIADVARTVLISPRA